MNINTKRSFKPLSLLVALLLTGTLAVTIAGVTTAGPLEPPAGSISPTMKTLDHVEARTPIVPAQPFGDGSGLYTFDQPGSYYLTGDIVVTNLHPESPVFSIGASDVTIDLNGFAVRDMRANAAISTITMFGPASRARIMNGSIVGGQAGAVFVRNGSILQDIQAAPFVPVLPSTIPGIDADDGSIVRACTVSGYGKGISLERGSIADECVVRGTVHSGIEVYQDSFVKDCVISNPGTYGVIVSESSVETTQVGGGVRGITVLSNGVARNNTVRNATTVGISCSSTAAATGNMVFNSGTNYIITGGSGPTASGSIVSTLNSQPETANLSR